MLNKEIRIVLVEKIERPISILDEYGEQVYEQSIDETIELIDVRLNEKKRTGKTRHFVETHMLNKKIIKIIEANGFIVRTIRGGFSIEITKFDNPCNTLECIYNNFTNCQQKNINNICKNYTYR